MKKRLSIKCLAFMLTLVLGLGPALSAVAMPDMNMEMGRAPVKMGMPGISVSSLSPGHAAAFKGCCRTQTNHPMKKAACDACCMAAFQHVVLAFQAGYTQYSVQQFHDLTDTVAVGKSLPPEPPPPKV